MLCLHSLNKYFFCSFSNLFSFLCPLSYVITYWPMCLYTISLRIFLEGWTSSDNGDESPETLWNRDCKISFVPFPPVKHLSDTWKFQIFYFNKQLNNTEPQIPCHLSLGVCTWAKTSLVEYLIWFILNLLYFCAIILNSFFLF